MLDNISLLWDMIDLARLSHVHFGLLDLDQEKAFDMVDHGYLFKTVCFWMWVRFSYGGKNAVYWGLMFS